MPRASRAQPLALVAVAPHQFASRRRAAGRRSCDSRRARAAAASPCRRRRCSVTGFGARKAAPRRAPSTAKPRGLSRSEAILARNLLDGQPDRDGDADLALDLARQSAPAICAGAMPCSRSVPDEIEEGLVDRHRLDQRRELEHQARAPRGRRAAYFVHVGRDDARVRAQPPRLEHRHRRAHAEGARDIAGGRAPRRACRRR